MDTSLSITPEQTARDQRICEFMSVELDSQIRAQFPYPEAVFGSTSDRNYILFIFSGRFVNYIHREKIFICKGEKLSVEAWKSIAKEFADAEAKKYWSTMFNSVYSAQKITEDLLAFLHKKGYALELPQK